MKQLLLTRFLVILQPLIMVPELHSSLSDGHLSLRMSMVLRQIKNLSTLLKTISASGELWICSSVIVLELKLALPSKTSFAPSSFQIGKVNHISKIKTSPRTDMIPSRQPPIESSICVGLLLTIGALLCNMFAMYSTIKPVLR
jgi:hypothetical protein